MTVDFQLPEGPGREPVVIVAVEHNRCLVVDAGAAEQFLEFLDGHDVADQGVAELGRPVPAGGAGHVALIVRRGIHIHFDDANASVGGVLRDPFSCDQNIRQCCGHFDPPCKRLSSHDPDVGDRVTFSQRRQSPDEHDDAAFRRDRLREYLTPIVPDRAEACALRDMRVARNLGVENPVVLGGNREDLFDPGRVRDRLGAGGRHLQIRHDATDAVDQRVDVFRIDGTGAARFGGNRRLAPGGRGVFQETRRRRVFRPVARDDDVIEPERQRHSFRKVVLLLVAGHGPVAVRPQVLVQVAAVQIDQVIALFDDLAGDRQRGALRLGAGGRTGVKAVHALVVDRIDVRREALERRHVDQRHQNQRS